MYSAFKEFYNLLSQVNSVYHDAALKLGLTDSELDILYSSTNTAPAAIKVFFTKRPAPQNPRSTLQYAGWNRPVICT
ncbi:MAG: hypothetical protein ACLUAR_04845 [Pilosibacter sp.]